MMSSRINLDDWDDNALVEQAIRRGASDDRPFSILFNRHKGLVWRVCYRFIQNSSDAEDLMQEIFIKAYRNLRTFEGRSTFRTWLYQITVNTCRNELRDRKRRPESIDAHVDDLELVEPGSQIRDTLNPDFANIATAMLQLRSDDREILIMRDIEEQAYGDIAAKLGIQLSAAKMRVQRARLALRSEIQAQENIEDLS